jgi:molybdopterin biosynthesis enzyme
LYHALMATLPDYAEALDAALAEVEPLGESEAIVLDDAIGRVLATPIVADRDLPPFNRAQMDGYALRAADTLGAAPYNRLPLAVIGLAGSLWSGWLAAITLGCVLAYFALFVRMTLDRVQRGDSLGDAGVYAGLHIVRKFGVAAGFLRYWLPWSWGRGLPDPHVATPPQPVSLEASGSARSR